MSKNQNKIKAHNKYFTFTGKKRKPLTVQAALSITLKFIKNNLLR